MARKNVNIRLDITGNKRVERDLKAVGTSGDRALRKVGAAATPASAKLRVLNATIGQSQVAMAGMAARAGSLGAALGQLGPVGVAVGAILAVLTLGMSKFRTEAVKAAGELDQLANASDRLGISVEALQELRFAGELESLNQNTVDMSIQRFTRRVGEAAEGTGEARAALAEMDIQLRDSNGRIRETEDLLGDVADALSEVEDSASRLRLAFKLFDSEGVAFVNILGDGRAGLDAIREAAREAGVVMEDRLVRNAGALNAELTTINNQSKNEWSEAMSGTFGPLAVWASERWRDLASGINDVSQGFRDLDRRSTERLQSDQLRLTHDLERVVALFGEADLNAVQLRARLAAIDFVLNPGFEDSLSLSLTGGSPRAAAAGAGPSAVTEIAANLAILEQLQQRVAVGNDPFEAWLTRLSEDALPETAAQLRVLFDEMTAMTAARRDAQTLEREGARVTLSVRTEQEAYNDALARLNELPITEDVRALAVRQLGIETGRLKDETEALAQASTTTNGVTELAAQLTERLMTNQERLNVEMAEYNKLLGYGKITQTTFNRAVEDAEDRLGAATFSADEFGETFSRHMLQGIQDMDRFGEALLSVIAKLAQMILFEQFIGPAFTSIGTSFASALPFGSRQGNVFMGGEPVAFRRGGVVTQPTTFMTPSGRRGKMAEENSEAIMPLVRLDGGDLGVRALRGPAPVFNVILSGQGAESAQVEQQQNDTGGVDLKIVLDEAVSGLLGDPGSQTSRAITQRGLGPALSEFA